MALLRFLMVLSLGVWLGSILFFGAVLAPTVFSVLPTRALAGSVVSRSLSALHIIGMICGVLFLLSSVIYGRVGGRMADVFATRNLLVLVMLLVTLYAQYGIGAKMNRMRVEMGEIDRVEQTDPRRVEFNRLHIWSTRLEGTVLIFGLAALFLTSRKLP